MMLWVVILLVLVSDGLSFITYKHPNRNAYRLPRYDAKSKGSDPERKNEESNAFDKKLNSLKFNYESRAKNGTGKIPSSYFVYQGNKRNEGSIVCGSPKQIPMRGCNMDDAYISPPLPNDEGTKLSTLRSQKQSWKSLPCIEEGTCPHVRFQCGKCKHEWKALAGSPVSLQCPKCSGKKKTAKKKKSTVSGKIAGMKKRSLALYQKLDTHAKSKGGICHADATRLIHWNSSIPFECDKGHNWDATVTNIIHKKTWCRACQSDIMEATAAAFGGTYLGLVEDEYSKADLRTQLSMGHFGYNMDEIDGYRKEIEQLRVDEYGNIKELTKAVYDDDGKVKDEGEGEEEEEMLLSVETSQDPKTEKAAKRRTPLNLSQKPARWRCSEGHVFIQSTNNIRRKAGSARKCSWCPTCAKAGWKFEWHEDSTASVIKPRVDRDVIEEFSKMYPMTRDITTNHVTRVNSG